MNAVIPVNQRIEKRFSDGDHRVIRPIFPLPGLRIDDGLRAGVFLDKAHCLTQHLWNGALNPLVVEESRSVWAGCTVFHARNDHRCYAKLWEIRLWIQREEHHRAKRNFVIAIYAHQFADCIIGHPGQMWLSFFQFIQIVINCFKIQRLLCGSGNHPNIIGSSLSPQRT